MKTQFFKPNVPQKISNMNWSQVKARFPLVKPYGDADKDGLRNKFDCKPFDIKRQGKKHDESKKTDEAWEKLTLREKALAEEGLLEDW